MARRSRGSRRYGFIREAAAMQALRRIAAVVSLIACVAGGANGSDTARQTSDAAIEAHCRPYFHDACSEAMGRWLPSFGFRDPSTDRAKLIGERDDFSYGSAPASSKSLLNSHGSLEGTFFVYGTAGPPKGRALYDRAHRIVFYEQGCCTWDEQVAAADTPAPPKFVKARDLRNLSTVRGIRLGQTQSTVTKIYGRKKSIPVAGHPGIDLLAYTTWSADLAGARALTGCPQTQDFFFRNNRLILIRIANVC